MELNFDEKVAIRIAIKHTLESYRGHFWDNVESYHNVSEKDDRIGAFNRCIFWNAKVVELKKVLEKIV